MEGERKDLDMRQTVERETGRRKTTREEVEGETGRRKRREKRSKEDDGGKKKKMKKIEDAWSWAGNKKKTILLRQTRKFKTREVPAFAIIKEERYSMKVSSYDNFFGSDDYDDDNDDSESDDDDDGMKMLPYPSSPHFATGFANAIWKSRIFFISGRIHGQYTPNVFAFHTKSKKWRECTPIPTHRTHHVAVVVKHHIYVFGGAPFLEHTISEDHWGQRYDIKKQTWKNLPSPPSVLYQLHTPTAFAVYYKCQAFTYTTKHHKPHQVPQNQNLILFPLPRWHYQFPISVFNCTENKWLPDLFPDLPSEAPPFITCNTFPNILQDRLAVIDGVLIWHHRGTIQGYDFLESKYLPELHTLPPTAGYESHHVCHPPMFLVHPGRDNKLHLIFQCVDYIVQCHVLLIQLRQQRQPGPRLSLHFHSHSSLSTDFMGQNSLEDVLLI